MNETETSEKHQTVTEAISDHMLVFDPKIQNAPGFLKTNQRDINRRRFKDLKYAFDYVFGPAASNKAVFEQTTKGIVNGVLNGYNCSGKYFLNYFFVLNDFYLNIFFKKSAELYF